MSKHHSYIDTVDQVITDGVNKGILHLSTQDLKLKGNKIRLKEKELVNFGSCSYLGLEFDKRMIRAATRAIENYGTQFSASRAYVSPWYYEELENKLGKIFNSPTIVAPTTTLGHIATIPTLIENDDAIILDHQVHHSVQNAVNLVKPKGVHVEMIRHNNMEMLEERVKKLRHKFKKIWYMADGIYSMYGDPCPVREVHELLNKYPKLHLYIDDAHGMSWTGNHGSGYVLSQVQIHDKMIMATSLNKAFASGGGALIFPNNELARKVRTCGGPLITSGPMQPGALGAAIASANIHLSDEINTMQDDLMENIRYTNMVLAKMGLPNVAYSESPVFFIGVSLPKVGYNLINRMMHEGYYLNLGAFPAVPMKNTGVRFTVTRLHTFEQIEGMVEAMAHHLPLALKEESMTIEKVYRAFKMPTPEESQMEKAVSSLVNQSNMDVKHCSSIQNVEKAEWDYLLGDRGTFDWEGLNFLEQTFNGNELPEDNWNFDYLIIKDRLGNPVLATFLTTCLAKDDMLSPSEISRQVEERRMAGDKYYLTSRTLMVGSLLTEGNHLFLDRSSPFWKDAMEILFEKISELQDKYEASVISIRDLAADDEEMDAFFMDNGYFKTNMPENHIVENMNWSDSEAFVNNLSPRSRRHIRQDVIKNEEKYQVEIIDSPMEKDLKCWYQLYLNVKEHNLALNTFALPYKLFKNMAMNSNWETIALTLKPEFDQKKKGEPVAIVVAYKGKENYNPMIVGLDYDCPREYNCYRQSIYRVIMRARDLNMKTVRLGFSATVEKKKYGARIVHSAAYLQAKENYNLEVVGTMSMAARN